MSKERKNVVYGYARVSSKDQNEERQLLALKKAEIPETKIFVDRQSGRDFNRPQYKRLLRRLKPGDLLLVTSIDRLGRDYGEIQEQWRHIVKDLDADIAVLDMPLLDTRRGKDLLGTFLSDVVLQVLSFAAQHEREAIRIRQAEGIAAARKRGTRFGRPPQDLPDSFEEAHSLWRAGALTVTQAAALCGMSRSTFHRKATTMEEIY